MAQHDYVIANDTAANVRADINNALAAVVSNNSGATQPTTMYANEWWYDTATDTLKIRAEANDAWISVALLNQTTDQAFPVVGGVTVTSTGTELNLLDGAVAGTIVNSKAVVYGAAGQVNATTLQIAGTSITATAAELNFVDGVTSAIQTQLNAKAALASPTFTGTPAAPTATAGTNTTQVATTAFVQTALGGAIEADYQVFTAAGTWTKPSGLSANALVIVEMWGAGGGGGGGSANHRGGGGGAFATETFLASALGATVAVGVGSGGPGGTGGNAGTAGGNSTFGSVLTAYGGGGGSGATSGQRYGGSGGGHNAVGVTAPNSNTTAPFGGGNGSGTNTSGDNFTTSDPDLYGGGGGGGPSAAGQAAFGGGGGGGSGALTAGISKMAGNGGAGATGTGAAGSAPAGGGGGGSTTGGAGGRGEVRVWTIG